MPFHLLIYYDICSPLGYWISLLKWKLSLHFKSDFAKETSRACFCFYISKPSNKRIIIPESQMWECPRQRICVALYGTFDSDCWILTMRISNSTEHRLGEVVSVRWAHSFLFESPELSSFQVPSLLQGWVPSFENRVGDQTTLKLIAVTYYFYLIKKKSLSCSFCLSLPRAHISGVQN